MRLTVVATTASAFLATTYASLHDGHIIPKPNIPIAHTPTMETPLLHLSSGTMVYHTPPSGGVIRVKDGDEGILHEKRPKDDVEGEDVWRPKPKEPMFGDPLGGPMMMSNVAGAATTSSTYPYSSSPDDEEEYYEPDWQDPTVAEYEIDITSLIDLTKGSLVVDLNFPNHPEVVNDNGEQISIGEEIEFLRREDEEFVGKFHPDQQDEYESEEEAQTRRLMNRKGHRGRRMRELAQDLALDPPLCNVYDYNGEEKKRELPEECHFKVEPATDYMPSSEFFPAYSASQKFTYFDGSALYRVKKVKQPPTPQGMAAASFESDVIFGSTSSSTSDSSSTQKDSTEEEEEEYTIHQAIIQLQRHKHPSLPEGHENEYYLSGIIFTHAWNYEFGLKDVEEGGTVVKIVDPTKIPGMPAPKQVPEDFVDDEDNDEYTGRRTLKRTTTKKGSSSNSTSSSNENNDHDDDNKEEEEEYYQEQRRNLKNTSNPHVHQVENPHKFGYKVQSGHLKREHANHRRRMQSDDGSVVDVVVAYTKLGLCESNNLSASACADKTEEYFLTPANHVEVINKANAGITYTNAAYRNSNINFQLRLVHTHFTRDYWEYGKGCSEQLDAFSDPPWRGGRDENMDEIYDLRNEWGADVVALLTMHQWGTCGGIAWLGPTERMAFSVTKARFSGGGTFAHELGHNFGCYHDRAQHSGNEHPYGYGWQDTQGQFRTIMAYSNGCGGPCHRIPYFSNPDLVHLGRPMGDARNDCARTHNEANTCTSGTSYYCMALNRRVRITQSPTQSHAPSVSLEPSQEPTEYPTSGPSVSAVPSLNPTTTSEPTYSPSEYPSFNNLGLDDFEALHSPRSTAFQVQHGIMFDITAKDAEIKVHNFAMPFLRAGNMTIHVYTREEGGFWYEKNNEEAWTLAGSPWAYSPGNTLENPVPLAQRTAQYYGFDPILIPPHTTRAIYLSISADSVNDNLIGMGLKDGSSCASDYLEPFDFQTWFENDDLAISEGVYKEQNWTSDSAVGTANNAYRFFGSIYYYAGTRMPSMEPSISSLPSISTMPSDVPSNVPSDAPSTSREPSAEPSVTPPLTPNELLDRAMLQDLLKQYVTYADSTCPNTAELEDATSFSFHFPGTNTGSTWEPTFVAYEESLFQAVMSHTDPNDETLNWEIRIGTGGNMYSHFTQNMYGETIPPQQHEDAPWIDEVQQMVSVNIHLQNNNNQHPEYCDLPDSSCRQYFIHQAGAYQRDSPTTDEPFFSPSLAKHCSGNTCMFASWGTQAHVATPFTSPIIYINRYTNCGNGKIEHVQMMHHFADPNDPQSTDVNVDQSYFNVGWGGVRSSSLPYALEPDPNTNTLSYTDVDDIDYLQLCPWGEDTPGEENGVAPWRGERVDIATTSGYTTFVEAELKVNHPVTLSNIVKLPCRKPNTSCYTDSWGCMEAECTDSMVENDGYTRLQLKVAPQSSPNCATHGVSTNGFISLQCDMRDENFGRSGAYLSSIDKCAPWMRIAFVNSITGDMLEIESLRHWSWNANDKRVYFSILATDADAAVDLVNGLFDNSGSTDELSIDIVPSTNIDANSEPADYDPSNLDTFTFVYGQGDEYSGDSGIPGFGRRRVGSTQQGIGTRDYTVFTINWLGTARLQPGSTYANRSFMFNSKLENVKTVADSLVPETQIDLIELEDWQPRRVDVYVDSGKFIVTTATAAQSTVQTTCPNPNASLVCSGWTTPAANYVAYFYKTCGGTSPRTYFGRDPYAFTPGSGTNYQFPGHGNSVNDHMVRSSVCDGEDLNVRPNWKLMGFFPKGNECDAVESLPYDRDVCDAQEERRRLLEETGVRGSVYNFPSEQLHPSVDENDGVTLVAVPIEAPSFIRGGKSRFLQEETISAAPSISIVPSVSAAPSNMPSVSDAPSISAAPSDMPSISVAPSISAVPSEEPSVSMVPSSQPSRPLLSLTAQHENYPDALDGIMFDIHAVSQNILVETFSLLILTARTDYNLYEPFTLSIYTALGGHYDAVNGDAKTKEEWTEIASVQMTTSTFLAGVVLPQNTFESIFIEMGTTMGFYITIEDLQRNKKLLTRPGETLLGNDPGLVNDDIHVSEGLAKQWDPCLAWGETFLVPESQSPRPYRFYGSIAYRQDGTSQPTKLPSAQPSLSPSISSMPSESTVPSLYPSVSTSPSSIPSAMPSISEAPTPVPTISQQPSYSLVSLQTPNNSEDQEAGEGNSGDGVMFDLVADKALEVYSVSFGEMASYPMNIRVYSRPGSHYAAYDDESHWDLIKSYTNYTYDINDENNDEPRRISFPPQYIGAGSTRAFYIAIVETYGEITPLMRGLLAGSNYLTGVWKSDDRLSVMEGVKFYGISESRPFGEGTPDSGIFMHGPPGGRSFNMKNAIIRYKPIDTLAPSVAPSESQVPSLSQMPSENPTESEPPSEAPSISYAPSLKPSEQPSISINPTPAPTDAPSFQPSISKQPSEGPSVSVMPSSMPSEQPSSQPSMLPSESPSISTMPSSQPSSQPSESPSISTMPSFQPSISLMPTSRRYTLESSSQGALDYAMGVMFDIVPKRGLVIETFHIDHISSSATSFEFKIFTRAGSWKDAPENSATWMEIGHVTKTTSQNPVQLPFSAVEPVTIYAGQTQGFYIACIGHFFAVRKESSGTFSENDDLSLYSGQRKYTTDTLFASGITSYRFQGKVKYSKVSDPPSSAPSEAPSSIPSVGPTGIPSSSPSVLPSGIPSISALPSSSSAFPSDEPSISYVPSSAPSESPSLVPTGIPSEFPTTTIAPTPNTEARVQISIPSKLTIAGFGMTGETEAQVNTIVSIIVPSIAQLINANLQPGQVLKGVEIVSINGRAVSQNFSFRRHLETVSRRLDGHIDIEYSIKLQEICENEGCGDAQEIANALYAHVVDDMQQEIESGAFAQAVNEEALKQLNQDLEIEITDPVFEQLVVTVLALLSIWYPSWTDGGYCLNNGDYPLYMSTGKWLESSRDACCSRYYSYDYASCMGVNNLASIGYYPAWDGTTKCKNDVEVPDYMRNDPSTWVYDDLESCCDRYYKYDYNECVVNSGGSAASTATNKWYVNHIDLKCEKDCDEASDATCGGAADSWKALFDTPSGCCENTLSWVATSVCEAQSLGLTPTGTYKWYVDWTNEKCVQDCNSGNTCGGIVTDAHVKLEDSVDSCCSNKLGHVAREKCEAESTNTAVSSTGSGDWYLSSRLNKCVQDCTGSSPCGGLAEKWDEKFDSLSTCCSEKLWWIKRSDCVA